MRTNSRRRDQGLVLAVLTVVLSLPELAQAQQTGLFPLAPIKRQRVPCDQEDPIYKTYKHQYFGYHPTCWRPFPDGWGCPSRLAPTKADWEKSLKETPLGNREVPGRRATPRRLKGRWIVAGHFPAPTFRIHRRIHAHRSKPTNLVPIRS